MDVKFVSTPGAKLGSISIVDGQVIALSDQSGMYYDLGGARYNVMRAATSTQAGGVKLTDIYASSQGTADSSVGASSYALYSAYNYLNTNCVRNDAYLRQYSVNGNGVGNLLGTASTAKLIYIVDGSNYSYFWFGVFHHNYEASTYYLKCIANNGLTAIANHIGTISVSGGSGLYTYINLIPTNVVG